MANVTSEKHQSNPQQPRKQRWSPTSLSSQVLPSQALKNDSVSTSISEDEAVAALVSSAEKRRTSDDAYRNDLNKLRQIRSESAADRAAGYGTRNKKQRFDRNDFNGSDTKRGNEAETKGNKTKVKELAEFGLSGALARDEKTGKVFNGVLLKFSEPAEARTPKLRWRLYVFRKSGENDESPKDNLIEVLHISKQSAYLFGRERKVADIPVDHPSLSRQHCVLQYRAVPDKNNAQLLRCTPYLIDLGTANGTFINGIKLDEARYYELKKKDVITLGSSTREYVILTEGTR